MEGLDTAVRVAVGQHSGQQDRRQKKRRSMQDKGSCTTSGGSLRIAPVCGGGPCCACFSLVLRQDGDGWDDYSDTHISINFHGMTGNKTLIVERDDPIYKVKLLHFSKPATFYYPMDSELVLLHDEQRLSDFVEDDGDVFVVEVPVGGAKQRVKKDAKHGKKTTRRQPKQEEEDEEESSVVSLGGGGWMWLLLTVVPFSARSGFCSVFANCMVVAFVL